MVEALAKPRSYHAWIDVAKGIGILFVIMGHTLFPLHAIIDVFHMPLFFILAGLTFRRYELGSYILKKADRIMVPYVFFAILSVPFAFLCEWNDEVIAYNGPLWFLQTLFCSSIITYFASVSQRRMITFLLLCLFHLISTRYQLRIFPFHLDRALWASVFVITGIILRDRLIVHEQRKKIICAFLFLSCIFLVVFGLYYLIYKPTGTFKSGEIVKGYYVLYFFSAVVGSLVVIYGAKCLQNFLLLQWLGKNSLVIMCVHFPFAQWWNTLIFNTVAYNKGGGYWLILALLSYVAITTFSVLCVFVFKRFFPKWTGYKSLLT